MLAHHDRLLDHERDTRPDDLCDRCGNARGELLQVKPGRFRHVCKRCQSPRECVCGCGVSLPKYLMVYTDNHEGGGEWFTESCAGVSVLELW